MSAGAEWQTDYSKMSKEELEKIRKMLYNQRALPVPERPGF
jgi:GST-like protein